MRNRGKDNNPTARPAVLTPTGFLVQEAIYLPGRLSLVDPFTAGDTQARDRVCGRSPGDVRPDPETLGDEIGSSQP